MRLADGRHPGNWNAFPGLHPQVLPRLPEGEQVTHRLQPVRDIHLTSQLDYGCGAMATAAAWTSFRAHRLGHPRHRRGELHEPGHRAQCLPGPGGGRTQNHGRHPRAKLIGRFLVKAPWWPACRCRGAAAYPPGHAGSADWRGRRSPCRSHSADRARDRWTRGAAERHLPAFFLSRFRPAVVLKANAPWQHRGQSLRKGARGQPVRPSPWCLSWARCSCSASTSTCCVPIRLRSRNRWW